VDIRETARRSASVVAHDTQALAGWSVAMMRKRALESDLREAEMELGRGVRDLIDQGEMQHPVLDAPLRKMRDIEEQIRRQDEEMARLRSELSLRAVSPEGMSPATTPVGPGDAGGTAAVMAAGHGEHDRQAAAMATGLEAEESISPPVEGPEAHTMSGPESWVQSAGVDEVTPAPGTLTGQEALAQSEGDDANDPEPPRTVRRRGD